MPQEISLRDYSPEDDFDEMFLLTREIISEPPYDDAKEELVRYPGRDSTAKVALNGEGRLIGFCASTHPYWNNIAMIDYLVVASGARRRGVGRKLIRAIEGALRDVGMRHACVQTASWNDDAIRFYEQLGYVRVALLPGYFGEGNDAVWLTHRLRPTESSG